MKSKDKDTGYIVNQIETSIPNQNNFLFNELQYVDVIADGTSMSATLDSGANSVISNSKHVSEVGGTRKILAAVCEIEEAILLPSEVFEFLKSESVEAESTDASCNLVRLQNETEGENHVGLSGGLANSEKQIDEWLEKG
ncbi:hypothetical protein TNCV_627041 [Trichonephila clavipes]|nr:hypothetical protein TNCV_627041 [Trichonephila clavipes]